MPQPPAAPMSDEQIRDRIASVPHWYHQIEIRPAIVTPGVNGSGAGFAATAERRAEVALSGVRQLLARSESELAGAREYIASLEAEVARKEAPLVAAYARTAELEADGGRTGAAPHERGRPAGPGRPGTPLARRLRRAATARRAR